MYRLLIVDTDPLVWRAIKAVADKVGGFGEPLYVASGEEAVRLCCTEPVDLAFLSTSIPGYTDMGIVQRIHACRPSLPMVLMTTRINLKGAHKAMSYKIERILIRPLSFAAIQEILLCHKAHHAYWPEQVVAALAHVVNEHNFLQAYAIIPQTAKEVRSLAGQDPARRHSLLMSIGEGLAAKLDRSEKLHPVAEPLTVPPMERLAPDIGVDFALFSLLDQAFRGNCLRNYPVMASGFSFIEGHIEDRISLEDIVEQCGVSQTHVSRVLKRCFGLSMMQYLHLRKIYAAKLLMVYKKQSATNAAFYLGYNEPGYFSKVFKKFEGMTVREFKTRYDLSILAQVNRDITPAAHRAMSQTPEQTADIATNQINR